MDTRPPPAAGSTLRHLVRVVEPGGPAAGDASAPAGAQALPTLELAFDLRSRSRLRARLSTGEEVALVLPRGTVLRDGALLAGDGLRVRVCAAPEDLLEVRAPAGGSLARLAYHLGNRHVPVEVGVDRLWLGYDHVLAEMLAGLQAGLARVRRPFEPEHGAYGGGHGHAHGGHAHG